MQTYQVTIKGTAPLLQNKIVSMETNVSKKSEGKDSKELAEYKLYKIGDTIVQPAINIEQGLIKVSSQYKIRGGGKKTYKDLFKGCIFVRPEFIPHENQDWEVHESTVVIPSTKGRINRYRPMLKEWSLSFEIDVLDDRIEVDVLKTALDEVGRTNSLGDYRPRFGRFIVTSFDFKGGNKK